ncbi:MAG: 50S ribosomal protein L11 methyltransferase [Planctomycetales bacterium]|nr:50S ribosomal protein L11 methyltransferase [Planctomycetales bacterium]
MSLRLIRIMKNPPPRSVIEETIPGGWSERELLLGDRTLRILFPAVPDEFLEQLEDSTLSEQEADPYWAELWPASLPLARLILSANWRPGTPAIELGCGIGVAGLAGLIAGLDLLFTDRVELAVDTAVENAHRNGCSRAAGLCLDWADPPRRQYPIILASDVLYDQALHTPLLNTIDAMLAPGGECWLGDPGRCAAVSFHEMAAGIDLSVSLRDAAGVTCTRFQTGEFRLLCLKRLT